MFEYQKVKLIGKTIPEPDLIVGSTPSEDLISYCARVSNPSNQENFETSQKLLKYCMKHKHWSIFEMVNVVMEINTTRDIGRQILRHKSFHFQEFSQRYANPEKEQLGFVIREARIQDEKNRQNSIEVDEGSDSQQNFFGLQDVVILECKRAYKNAIKMGIAKEQARALLPEGLTMSRMYMNGTLRDWYHYCKLRMGPETQKEHRDIAQKCWNELVTIFPFLKEEEQESLTKQELKEYLMRYYPKTGKNVIDGLFIALETLENEK